MDIKQIGENIKKAREKSIGSTYIAMRYADINLNTIRKSEKFTETITMKTISIFQRLYNLRVYLDGVEIEDFHKLGCIIALDRARNHLTYKDIADRIGVDEQGHPLITLQAVKHIIDNAEKAKVINLLRIFNVLGHNFEII